MEKFSTTQVKRAKEYFGLEGNYSQEDLQSAKLAMVKLYHPDKQNGSREKVT